MRLKILDTSRHTRRSVRKPPFSNEYDVKYKKRHAKVTAAITLIPTDPRESSCDFLNSRGIRLKIFHRRGDVLAPHVFFHRVDVDSFPEIPGCKRRTELMKKPVTTPFLLTTTSAAGPAVQVGLLREQSQGDSRAAYFLR